ncbi:MAG: glycosyltransferase family 2 protein [Ilumatobacteraceae bacterium]
MLWSLILFSLGWSAGWIVLWRATPLPPSGGPRGSVSIVVPARDEAAVVGTLLASVIAQLEPGDELIVVDDHSTDDTAHIAREAGATVVSPPPLPVGWAGKPHACHVGAQHASSSTLVFLDADVSLGPDDLSRLAAEVERHPDDLVSVQPWHRVERPYEQSSLLFNITALMGAGASTPLGQRVATHVAFGPVIACRRDAYDRSGGHAHESVRSAVLEDIALARRFPRSRLFVGGRSSTTFRMYPAGFGQLIEGWTKGAGIGLDATPWWALVCTAGWVTSLAGGWLTSPWFALASLVQLAVFARRAGSFRWWAVLLFPLAVALFVVVLVRSWVLRHTRRTVSWKGRDLVPDQDTG